MSVIRYVVNKKKNVTYVYISENKKVDGKNRRRDIKNLGVLGKEVNLRQAQRILAEYNSGLRETKVRKVTFKQAHDYFKPIYKDKVAIGEIRQRTFETFEYAMKKALPHFGHILLDELDIDDFENFKTMLIKNDGNNPYTVRIHLSEIKKILNYSIDKKWIKSYPPIRNVKINSKKEADVYSEEEIKLLLENAANNDQIFYIKLLLYTGLRPHEAVQLKIEHVNLDDNQITIESYQKNKLGGKIPLHCTLKEAIISRINEGSIIDYISPYRKAKYATRAVQRIGRRLGIECSSYKFRATFNTRLIKMKIDSSVRAKLLRHSNIDTQYRFYTGDIDETLNEAISCIS